MSQKKSYIKLKPLFSTSIFDFGLNSKSVGGANVLLKCAFVFKNSHFKCFKVRLRLVRSIDRDLSLQSILFAHHVHLCLPPYSGASYKRAPAENKYIDCFVRLACTGV